MKTKVKDIIVHVLSYVGPILVITSGLYYRIEDLEILMVTMGLILFLVLTKDFFILSLNYELKKRRK